MKMLVFAVVAVLLMDLVFLPGPARAVEIDFGQILTGADGEPLNDGTEAKVTLTLGRAVAIALMAQYPTDLGVSDNEKLIRGVLALKIYEGGKLDLPAESIALIKRYLAKAYGPLVIAKATAILDPGAVASALK